MSRITKAMIRESHRQQFEGVDYQRAAWEVVQGLKFTPDDDETAELESGPFEGCDCGFCATAPWVNDTATDGHDCPAGDIRDDE